MGNALSLSGDEPERKQHELAQTGAASSAQHEIQSAIIIAKKMPRKEADCFQKLMMACTRPSLAEDATYSFPRGKKPDGTPNEVTGPSVNLAREAARIWGNIRFGLSIIRDDEESRLIRGWCWDVEMNTKVEVEDDFKKLIQRKDQGWIVPDERDLRELTNRRGAILLRNAILQVLPKDLIEDALNTCAETLEKKAAKDPDATRKRLLFDFGTISVSVDMIEKKLGHAFSEVTPKEMAELRGVCKSIQDGNSTWAEYVKGPDGKPAEQSAESKANEAALAKGQEALAKQQEKPKDLPKSEETKAEPMTCAKACDLLADAKDIKTIAATRLAFDNNPNSTPAERKQVNDHANLALKRINPSGKK